MKVVVCHTGGVGSQVVRLLLAHPQHELIGVLAHDESKGGVMSASSSGSRSAA